MAEERNFGPIEFLDRIKMKSWLSETGVTSVDVWDTSEGQFMQRVGTRKSFLAVKKRFQKAPKNKK